MTKNIDPFPDILIFLDVPVNVHFILYIHAWVCIYVYIINIHSKRTHTMKENFLLDVINSRLMTALIFFFFEFIIYIYIYIYITNQFCPSPLLFCHQYVFVITDRNHC